MCGASLSIQTRETVCVSFTVVLASKTSIQNIDLRIFFPFIVNELPLKATGPVDPQGGRQTRGVERLFWSFSQLNVVTKSKNKFL